MVTRAREGGEQAFAISVRATGNRAQAQWLLVALGVAIALVGAGCGGDSKETTSVLRAFFAGSKRAQQFSSRYPHTPGAEPCTVRVKRQSVNATCSADVSLVDTNRAVITLTEAWDHGALAHTWFFFVRRNGVIEAVVQEGSAPSH